MLHREAQAADCTASLPAKLCNQQATSATRRQDLKGKLYKPKGKLCNKKAKVCPLTGMLPSGVTFV